MANLLDSYKNEIRKNNIQEFSDEELQISLSAVVLLLRRHSSNNKLCCHDNENNLEVTVIDKFGFVTQVRCTVCEHRMKTECYDKWKKERINDKSQLKVGDHICWHRPFILWHHAIVSSAHPLRITHYNGEVKVVEIDFNKAAKCHRSCRSCDALYRINYQDCYSPEYTVLRAKRLWEEHRYNLVEQNCEHFSSWCKTGSKKSSQVTKVRKITVTICLRLIALLILFLIQYSYERFEYKVEHRQEYANVEKHLTCAYIAICTVVFVIHLVIATGKQLTADPRSKEFDIENPSSCGECNADANESKCRRLCICCLCTCYSLSCKPVLGFFTHCKQCCYQCCCCCTYPCICCGRPGNLACGLFCRTVLREIPGLIGTVCIVEYEDKITYPIADHLPIVRTLVILSCILAVQLLGYIIGALLGRWMEACCECSSWSKEPSGASNMHENNNRHTTQALSLIHI